MKIKTGFKLMRVGIQKIVVAVEQRAEEFNGMIRLNETGCFLWELLEKGAQRGELAEALVAEYGITPESATADVDVFFDTLLTNGILEE